jgi:hypothetical protein
LLFCYITSPREILSSNVVSVFLVVFCAVVGMVTLCLPTRILVVYICVLDEKRFKKIKDLTLFEWLNIVKNVHKRDKHNRSTSKWPVE